MKRRFDSRVVYSTDPDPRPRQAARSTPTPPPASQQVRVQRERKGRRGKTVSIIVGLQGSTKDRKAVLTLLKRRLGTGGALKDDAIEIQGDHRERIVEVLLEMGYSAKVAGG